MTTNTTTVQCAMEWARHYPETASASAREWLARTDAGQACEVWEVDGGADLVGGFTVCWVPAERVAWAFNCGVEPMWYANVDHPRDFETAFTASSPLQPLPHYVGLSAQCLDCHTRLTARERAWAQRQAEPAGDAPDLRCESCADLSFDTWQYAMEGILQAPPDSLDALQREWLARYHAGHACEVWAVAGGADHAHGVTVLWVPAERLAWAGSYGMDFLWYGNVEHPRDFETFCTDPATTLRPIPYVPLSARCRDCRTRLTAPERERAQICADVTGDLTPSVQCDICVELAGYERTGGAYE